VDELRLRVSSCGASFWDGGRLVWHDTLAHRRFVVREDADLVLRCFADWHPLRHVRTYARDDAHADALVAIAERLHAVDVLVAWRSARHRAEEANESGWGRWGRLVALFHTDTRNLRDERFITAEANQERLRQRLDGDPAPPVCRELPAVTRRVALAPKDGASWARSDFLDVLSHRRSTRRFGDAPVPFASLSALLRLAAGITELDEPTQTAFKTSASGGGRHPTEVYVHAHRVAGLEPGLYHLNTRTDELELVGPPRDPDTLVALIGDQEWVADSGCVVFFTSVLARSMWKYSTPRTYRMLHVDVGHLSQTCYLLAAALGLGMTFTAAIQDENLEEWLGIDAAHEIVMGCSVIGTLGEPG
jgi:SagB-type dehydrogenase family enzyme